MLCFVFINLQYFVVFVFLVKPPAYSNTFSINADSGILEVKTAIDREECPYLIVGIEVVIVILFKSQLHKLA